MKAFIGVLAASLSLSIGLNSYKGNATLTSLEAESSSNGFSLFSAEKEDSDSFVYSGYINFKSGQAGGLAFGAKNNEHYFVFNMDRYENKVKLLYFSNYNGSLICSELLSDYFIGNDKMTDSEKAMVNPKVKTLDEVNLKVILTREDDYAYCEFYADGIKRFGIDSTYDLNNLLDGVSYTGGYLGLNVYNGKVSLNEVALGQSDYSYYSELYRNQYHYSQFAHWNNDPNGMVYYNGYYHLYYQTHPFSEYWSDMYWGHARSKDLLHWENLPICLFPDNGTMGVGDNDGYMWSGSSMVYHEGMSDAVDSLNWFGQSGTGLIAFLTRDGSGSQDQIIISSDDEGLTWTKRALISQSLTGINDRKIDFRDPKVFPITKIDGKVTRWGMSVSSMGLNKVYFLESSDLINWSLSSSFNFEAPECLDVLTLDCGGTSKDVITICGRYYLVGNFSYAGKITFTDEKGRDISNLSAEEMAAHVMDYGPDSYATQCFYIDDSASGYYGQYVSMSWFSGVPGASRSVDSGTFAQVRHPWNGGGMTIPVSYSLAKEDASYCLRQTPVTRGNPKLEKKNVVSVSSEEFDPASSYNPLSEVNSHVIEIEATIENENSLDVSFKIDLSNKEYLEIGWNKSDGYYVDRSHLGCANLSFSNYKVKYSSNVIGDSKKQTFYILSDNGGVEVFANDFKTPFYVLTLASPYSNKAEFSSSGKVSIANLQVNEIASTYRDSSSSGEGMIYLSKDEVNLDTRLHKEETITAYCTNNGDISFSIEDGEEFVALKDEGNEATLIAKSAGEATIKVTSNETSKLCKAKIHNAEELSVPFDEDGVIEGGFYQDGASLVGSNDAGDGYILSSKKGSDFVYQSNVDMSKAKAAALIVKANEDMSRYICVNYDRSINACKVWSNFRQLACVGFAITDFNNVLISAQADGDDLIVSINGSKLAQVKMSEEEKEDGYFGLNVFQGTAIFSSLSVSSHVYDYSSGDLMVPFPSLSSLKKVINVTEKNTLVPSPYCAVSNNTLIIKEAYFSTLKEAKAYTLLVEGYVETYQIKVNVAAIPTIKLNDLTLSAGENAVFFIGSKSVDSITLNGAALASSEFKIKDFCLTIYASALAEGVNVLRINDLEVRITVSQIERTSSLYGALNSIGIGYTAILLAIACPIVGIAIFAEGII